MSPLVVRYTLFAHVEGNKGHQEAKPWPDLAAQLADHKRGPRGGPCLSCGTFTATRGVKTIAARTAIGLDIEQRAELIDQKTGQVRRPAGPLPPPPWDIAAKIRGMGWAGVIHSTHSHSVDDPRCRVILEIEAPFDFPEPPPDNVKATIEADTHRAAREIARLEGALAQERAAGLKLRDDEHPDDVKKVLCTTLTAWPRQRWQRLRELLDTRDRP